MKIEMALHCMIIILFLQGVDILNKQVLVQTQQMFFGLHYCW